jgi:YVTN family beta-propeller protein
MDYRILGPFEVRDNGRVVALGGEKQRAVLTILLLSRNEVVSADRLIDDLWGEAPPASALPTLRAYVSRLRKALAGNGASPGSVGVSAPASRAGVLVSKGHGYLLDVAPGELDLERFQAMADRGRDALAAGQPEQAARLLRQALELWRGPVLADFAYAPFAQAATGQLEELHLAAVEDRLEADLAVGQARELIGELRDLVERHPLRERLRGQLMLALYRSGRQAEALGVYQEFRRALSEQLGLEPTPSLDQLQLAILGHDPALDLPASGATTDASEATSNLSVLRTTPKRPRFALALAGLVLLGLVLAAVVGTSGGRAPLTTIPGNSVGAISPSGGGIESVVPLDTSPSALAAGDGSVWVANYNAGTVSRIDPVSRSVIQTIAVGTTPAGVAAGAGAVWVVNNYGQSVSRIDPVVNRVVQTIAVGNAPTGAAVADGSVWVANSSDGTLSRIDAVTGSVTGTIALGGAGATDVATGAGGVWVSDETGDRVLRIDAGSDQVTASIHVGAGPSALVAGFGSVWVANSLDGTVSRIDPATNAVDATIAVGNGAGALAVGRGAVWVTNQYAGTVSRIDPATDMVAQTIIVASRPRSLAIAGGMLWVSAGPAATGHRGGTLNLLSPGTADTADPVLRSWTASQLAYDGLTAYQRIGGSGSTQLVPDLAVSLPSPTDAGTAYTFQLRQGIRYSNGQLVRPEDFRRALERDLLIGPNPFYGDAFANVVGGAACHPSHCDLSRGVATDDSANTVTFHLVAPNPEFLARLTLLDAVAVPADTPNHDVGTHPVPATGPYKYASFTPHEVRMVRNPYFHEWSHAAQPDGYPDQIVFRSVASQSAALAAVQRGTADYAFGGVPPDRLNELQTRFASRLYVNPYIATDGLVLNARVAPFNDVRVRRALNYAIDRGRIAALLGNYAKPTCQILPPYLSGYRRYCPYTLNPNPSGVWHAPDLAKAKRLIAASHTRGTPITIWNLGAYGTDLTPIEPYLVSLFDRLGYPTQVKEPTDNNAPSRFGDSRAREQAALWELSPQYLSASQIIQVAYACKSFVPASTGNSNASELCDPQLDAQIDRALAAENTNSPDAAALWAQADQTATDQAPAVPLTTPSTVDFVSSRVGNYQYSFAQGAAVLPDQLWVR